MIWRFSLYGFLKNQKYYEMVLFLAFVQRGLSFAVIGLLIGFREVMINLMEVPSGAIADLLGRRKSMILSFVGYILSFVLFSFAQGAPLFFVGMVFFAVGDAFRTGTHKAMIFTWLKLQGRETERTRVYGYTRSWSQNGTALAAVISAIIVFTTQDYTSVFLWCIIPYVLGIINFLGYPKELDGDVKGHTSLGEVARHLKTAFAAAVRKAPLRRVLLEAMGFHGIFKASKDYLQPILQGAAGVWISANLAGRLDLGSLSGPQKTALLFGPVYFVLAIVSSISSRHVHRVVDRFSDDERAARGLWIITFAVFAGLVPMLFWDVHAGMIGGFVLVYILHNMWRPLIVGRVDAHAEHTQKATVLSIESQASSVATMIIAPIIGFSVDYLGKHPFGGQFWPIGLAGTLISLTFLLTARLSAPVEETADE